MEFVYICSPLRGDFETNINKANSYCRFAVGQGVVPIAPHVMFTGFLDDNNPEERQMGMAIGIELLKIRSEIWVFGTGISEGMNAEIMVAKQLKIPIEYFDENCERRNHENRY